MMLVLEIVTLFAKPLLALLVVLANRRSRARQILRRMVEVQNLLINVGTKKIPVGSCAIRNTDKMRCRIQRLYPNNLTLHAIEKCLFSILRRRSHINRMQTLATLVVERKAPCHRFPPLLVADQHAGAIDPDTNRRHLAGQSPHGWPNPANWPSDNSGHGSAQGHP